MSDTILLAKSVEADKITYGTVKSLDSGGKSVYVAYNGRPLIIQTPEMSTPFGVSKWSSDRGGSDKYTLELSFKGREEKQGMQTFFELLETLDTKFVQDAMENSTNWLKKKYNSTEVVQALYTPLVKHAKDKETGEITDKYPPTFRITLPYKDGSFTCDTYDKQRNLIPLESIVDHLKGARVTAIIQCLGLWIAGGKFGCSWKVLQLRVAQPNTIKGFAFKDDDDTPDANNDDKDVYIQSSEDEDVPTKPVTVNDDDDNDDDEEEEILEDEDDAIDAPPPPPPPVKTVTVKKPAPSSTKKAASKA